MFIQAELWCPNHILGLQHFVNVRILSTSSFFNIFILKSNTTTSINNRSIFPNSILSCFHFNWTITFSPLLIIRNVCDLIASVWVNVIDPSRCWFPPCWLPPYTIVDTMPKMRPQFIGFIRTSSFYVHLAMLDVRTCEHTHTDIYMWHIESLLCIRLRFGVLSYYVLLWYKMCNARERAEVGTCGTVAVGGLRSICRNRENLTDMLGMFKLKTN